MFSKFITKITLNKDDDIHVAASHHKKIHALAAQESEQKKKACINFIQMNLFSKWYCKRNTLPHNWNL